MYKIQYSDLVLIFTLYIINIILYFITFSWIVLLEKNKCECGRNWKRDFIKYFILAMIFLVFVYAIYEKMALCKVFRGHEFILDKMWYILFISEIIFVTIVFIYIRDLIKNKCKCGESANREMYSLYSSVDILIFIITCLIAFGFIIYRFIS